MNKNYLEQDQDWSVTGPGTGTETFSVNKCKKSCIRTTNKIVTPVVETVWGVRCPCPTPWAEIGR